MISVFPVDGNKLFKSNNAGVYFFPKKGEQKIIADKGIFVP